MISKISSTLRRDEGFSLIELLIVVAIIGIIAAIAIPQLMNAMDRGRQRRSMADIRSIMTATGTYRVDLNVYAPNLAALAPDYLQVVPTEDAWGTAFVYATPGACALCVGGVDSYSVVSLGSDAGAGPAAPDPWINEPFEPDIQAENGQFLASPGQ